MTWREFDPLLGGMDWKGREERAEAKGRELAEKTSADLNDFVTRAVRFLRDDRQLTRLNTVAWSLGSNAGSSEVVRSFVTRALALPEPTPRTYFSIEAAASWVFSLRQTDPTGAAKLVADLLAACGSDRQRMALAERLYGVVAVSAMA